MAEVPVRRFTLDDLKRINQAARLELPEADLERLYPEIAGYLAAVGRLSEIELGETEPAPIFQPGGKQ